MAQHCQQWTGVDTDPVDPEMVIELRPGDDAETKRLEITSLSKRKHDEIVIEIGSETEDEVGDGFDEADKEIQVDKDVEDNRLLVGNEFEKLEYDERLDDSNPWHGDLKKPLLPAQVIGFHFLCDRHGHGGALVADRVGCGKVSTRSTFLI
jgi:hypothetical protein